jgi:hypothetical protein
MVAVQIAKMAMAITFLATLFATTSGEVADLKSQLLAKIAQGPHLLLPLIYPYSLISHVVLGQNFITTVAALKVDLQLAANISGSLPLVNTIKRG